MISTIILLWKVVTMGIGVLVEVAAIVVVALLVNDVRLRRKAAKEKK